MTTNIGINDKLVRLICAVIFAVLAFNVHFSFGILAILIVFTVITSWCPVMQIIGKNTSTLSEA